MGVDRGSTGVDVRGCNGKRGGAQGPLRARVSRDQSSRRRELQEWALPPGGILVSPLGPASRRLPLPRKGRGFTPPGA